MCTLRSISTSYTAAPARYALLKAPLAASVARQCPTLLYCRSPFMNASLQSRRPQMACCPAASTGGSGCRAGAAGAAAELAGAESGAALLLYLNTCM